MYRKFFKRFIDISVSLIGLIVLSIPMLLIAIAVKIDSKGPAVFKTQRVGRNGNGFKFYKFRSMRTDAPKDCAPALLDSGKYITKLGKFLRKTSLDELPQLICILKGDMSIVGPRPAGFSEKMLNEMRDELGVSKVRPGLTGWAQVNGRDVTAADLIKKTTYDAEYCEQISFKMDCKIFWLTIKNVLKSDGIVEGAQVYNVLNANDSNESVSSTSATTVTQTRPMAGIVEMEVAADIDQDINEEAV